MAFMEKNYIVLAFRIPPIGLFAVSSATGSLCLELWEGVLGFFAERCFLVMISSPSIAHNPAHHTDDYPSNAQIKYLSPYTYPYGLSTQ